MQHSGEQKVEMECITVTEALLQGVSVLADAAGGFTKFIDIGSKSVILIAGIGGVVLFFFKGLKWCKFFTTLSKDLDVATKKTNALMDKIVPRLIQGFEKKGFVPENSLAEWTEIMSASNFTSNSPKYLNDTGKKLLADCGMEKIINDNNDKFIADLEAAKLTTALDVEEKSFYVLDARKEETIFHPLKTYIYQNPDANIYNCFYVGSLRLRDIYLKLHKDLV